MWLHYKEYGDGNSTLMVFIHGGGVSGWMWDKQIEYFCPNFHCLVPDMPEHGRSKNGVQFTINDAADQINELEKQRKTCYCNRFLVRCSSFNCYVK